MFADLSTLPAIEQRRGGDIDTFQSELLDVINASIAGTPRSKQRKIGPSEIGHPCARRLGYRHLGVEKIDDRPRWRPAVGTAVHEWLANTFTQANAAWREEAGVDVTRWLVEFRVDVGDDITGSCDLYDRVTATLVDWKIVGTTTIREARTQGPSDQYRVQAHAYARGWVRRGLPVDTVGIYYLPSAGELHEGYLWTEPYDEQVALDGLQRLREITALTDAFGTKALPVLDTTAVNPRLCRHCPWHLPAATDLSEACPGPDTKKSASPAA